MYVTELDTFVTKFHQLWRAGLTAHLNLDTHAGAAWVGLRVQLGQAPGPVHQYSPPRRRSPAYGRRQERRRKAACDRATASTTAKVVGTSSIISDAESSDLAADKATNVVEANEIERETETTSAEEADNFSCDICDFTSNWANGLNIHMARKHATIEQVDGCDDEMHADTDYENSLHYWNHGWLGSGFQTYLDAMAVIEASDLAADEKKEEKSKAMEARKEALGSNFEYFPPWSSD